MNKKLVLLGLALGLPLCLILTVRPAAEQELKAFSASLQELTKSIPPTSKPEIDKPQPPVSPKVADQKLAEKLIEELIKSTPEGAKLDKELQTLVTQQPSQQGPPPPPPGGLRPPPPPPPPGQKPSSTKEKEVEQFKPPVINQPYTAQHIEDLKIKIARIQKTLDGKKLQNALKEKINKQKAEKAKTVKTKLEELWKQFNLTLMVLQKQLKDNGQITEKHTRDFDALLQDCDEILQGSDGFAPPTWNLTPKKIELGLMAIRKYLELNTPTKLKGVEDTMIAAAKILSKQLLQFKTLGNTLTQDQIDDTLNKKYDWGNAELTLDKILQRIQTALRDYDQAAQTRKEEEEKAKKEAAEEKLFKREKGTGLQLTGIETLLKKWLTENEFSKAIKGYNTISNIVKSFFDIMLKAKDTELSIEEDTQAKNLYRDLIKALLLAKTSDPELVKKFIEMTTTGNGPREELVWYLLEQYPQLKNTGSELIKESLSVIENAKPLDKQARENIERLLKEQSDFNKSLTRAQKDKNQGNVKYYRDELEKLNRELEEVIKATPRGKKLFEKLEEGQNLIEAFTKEKIIITAKILGDLLVHLNRQDA